MSLIGIDVGASSVKVAACAEMGELIASASHDLTRLHPAPGLWETDPEDIWQATSQGRRDLIGRDLLRRDPLRAIAVSASGRENFPADALGKPLGNGVMGADVRGAEFEVPPPGSPVPEPWCLSCGHLREGMDPIFRLEWWRKYTDRRSAHPGPGTLGAPLLAVLAVGVYQDLEGISRQYSGTRIIFTPHPERAALHQERLETYHKLMTLLLDKIY